MLYARRLGVFHAEVEKSMRITRTPSFVKFSRQNGQTGVSRDDVLLTMLLQQFKQRICPSGGGWLMDATKKILRLTTWDAVREAVWAVLFCADVANGTWIKSEHFFYDICSVRLGRS